MPALFEPRESAADNLIARLDVRTKMAVCLAASVVVVIVNTVPALVFLLLVSTIYVLGARRTKPVFICCVAAILMWLLSVGFSYSLRLLSTQMPVTHPITMLIPFMRTLIMMHVILALALSSRPQHLLTALKSLHLPAWLYIPSAVMIRFMPTFISDIRQIHEAMRTRGYHLNLLFCLCRPILAVRLLIVPILFRALRSADDLAMAAELKGISVAGTLASYKPHYLQSVDMLAGFVTLLCIGIAFLLHQIPGARSLSDIF